MHGPITSLHKYTQREKDRNNNCQQPLEQEIPIQQDNIRTNSIKTHKETKKQEGEGNRIKWTQWVIKDFITKQIIQKWLVKALSCTHTETFTADHHVLCHETNPAEADGGQTELAIMVRVCSLSLAGGCSVEVVLNEWSKINTINSINYSLVVPVKQHAQHIWMHRKGTKTGTDIKN